MNNRIVHFEIHAQNPADIAKFYSDVFGWDIKKAENMDYWMVLTGPVQKIGEPVTDPGINGGITKRMGRPPQGGEVINAFVCTVNVPNVDQYLDRIVAAGGMIAAPKMPIPGMAWLAYAKDIEGNIFGLFEEDSNAK